MIEIHLNDFAVIVHAGFQLKKELQPCFHILADFLVSALEFKLVNVKGLSERQITIKVYKRSQSCFGSFENGFDRLVGILRIQRDVEECANGLDEI